MTDKERSPCPQERDPIVEFLATLSVKKIPIDQLSSHDQGIYSIYYNIADDNPEFQKQIKQRIKELSNENSSPPPQNELIVRQPKLPLFESDSDPGKIITDLGKKLNSPYYRNDKDNIIVKDIRHKRFELRKKIGLPVNKNKYPEEYRKFIVFLRKHVYKFDDFNIFKEYDRLITSEIPPELDLRIAQVTIMISNILNPDQKNRYKLFHHYVDNYQETGTLFPDFS